MSAAVTALAACGGGSSDIPATESSVSEIPTKFADVSIAEPARSVARSCLAPSAPDAGAPDAARIAVTDISLLDPLCALGEQTKVVAVTAERSALPYYLGPTVTNLPALGSAPDPARARDTHPDVVLTTDPASAAARAFGTAKVVTIDPKADWRTRFLAVSAALGRAQTGTARLSDVDDYARAVGAGVDARHTQVSLVRVLDSSTVLPGVDSFAGQILTLMGADRPKPQRGAQVTLTDDNFDDADGDIIYVSYPAGETSQSRAEALLKSDRWLSLGAVGWKREFISDDYVWYEGQGVIAARWVVADLQRTINGATS
ncbi:ABC transporter substrate-binding protein [Gordonia jinhuaensis]|uniref:ABC transporter substrate-binding protein n=1 Tax=Gordonia jinhuaensis TaxID=1517702 RepID=UPI00166F078C|nr:ABC transporter substrate-binding protein [Gordonia jinhuaensis]